MGNFTPSATDYFAQLWEAKDKFMPLIVTFIVLLLHFVYATIYIWV